MSRFDQAFRKKFWSRIEKGDRCWEWTAGCTAAGYGQLQARKINKAPMLAHRVSWELRHGPIPHRLHVLHKCDNPACVRPAHLFLGTQRDNNLDRDRKGRVASGDRNGARTHPDRNPFIRNRGSGIKGDNHPNSKITDLQVKRLREEFDTGVPRAKIAAKYGLSITHVYRIGSRDVRKED